MNKHTTNFWIFFILIFTGMVVLVSSPTFSYVSDDLDFMPMGKGTQKASLFVETKPANARIRILNIVPRFYQGIELESGRYSVEISATGYETKKKWVEIGAGKNRHIDVGLKKIWIAGASTTSGKVFTNSIGMKFVLIPAGTLMMGSPSSEKGRDSHETQHRVTISKAFYMQTTEVTVGQWRTFVRVAGYKTEAETKGGSYIWAGSKWEKKEGYFWDNPGFSQTNRHPVTCVSWNDVQAFMKWLCRKEDAVYRLPTEAEWEYACRAGTTTPFSFGKCLSTDQANYDGNYPLSGCPKGIYREKTVSVGSFRPNAWGLYDMHGNVWEWCQDWFGDYPSGHVTNPKGPSSGFIRVYRGGSWYLLARHCRSAHRYYVSPGARSYYLGFRLALRVVGQD